MKATIRIATALGWVILATGLVSRPAGAGEPTEDEANASFLAGRYQQALEAYVRLYATSKEPTYEHNIARCYQKLGNPEEAIDHFNRYLREAPNLDESVKVEVRGYIREMEALEQSRRKQRSAPAETSSGPGQGPSPLPGALTVERHEGPNGPRPTSSLRTAAIVVAGVGLLAAGVGVYYGIRTRTLEGQVASAKTFDRAADSDGETAHTMQFGMYGVAGACLIGSVVLYTLGSGANAGSRAVSLLPSLGPTYAGESVTARF